MAEDHGPTIKNDKRYEALKDKGMSKQRAASIANDPGSSSKGGKASARASATPTPARRHQGAEGGGRSQGRQEQLS